MIGVRVGEHEDGCNFWTLMLKHKGHFEFSLPNSCVQGRNVAHKMAGTQLIFSFIILLRWSPFSSSILPNSQFRSHVLSNNKAIPLTFSVGAKDRVYLSAHIGCRWSHSSAFNRSGAVGRGKKRGRCWSPHHHLRLKLSVRKAFYFQCVSCRSPKIKHTLSVDCSQFHL